MPVLYSVISRGNTVLAKYTECGGNFAEVTEKLIAHIELTNHKLTYTHGNYLFHYICSDKIIYMCITNAVTLLKPLMISLGLMQFIVFRNLKGPELLYI